MKIIVLVLLVLYNSVLMRAVEDWSAFDSLEPYSWETEKFRAMLLGENMARRPYIDCEELAALMLKENFNLLSYRGSGPSLRFPVKRQEEFLRLSDAYREILGDLVCFPVPKSTEPDTPDVTYSDGWLERRTFGGERSHEGCDIMGAGEPSGFYPVVSMTDGVIEQAGWLAKGGWRLGIRSPSGAYLYYAHLSGYSKEWRAGDLVEAGALLGYMGDSGYGEEGTTGQFPVHLHLGVYIKTEHWDELSVNPYWLLRHLEQYRTRASY